MAGDYSPPATRVNVETPHRGSVAAQASRVKAVRDALIAAGVAADRLTIAASGELNEKSVGKDAACLERDRRVEIIVLPRDRAAAVKVRGFVAPVPAGPKGSAGWGTWVQRAIAVRLCRA